MGNLLFKELNISDEIKKSLDEQNILELTPVQEKTIEIIIDGEDVLAQAPTGTGKTLAFGIPLLEKVDTTNEAVQGLILAPTRELAIQTANELQKTAKYMKGLKTVCVYGGQPIEQQFSQLRQKPQIVVATPGRLMDHMRRRRVNLQDLKMIILDEADEMLNMGFREDIETILEQAKKDTQTLLFSATVSREILNIAKKFQKEDVKKVKISGENLTVSTISQYYLEVKYDQKTDLLKAIIDMNQYKLSLIFCNTKRKVDELMQDLTAAGYAVEALHGDMKQMQRDRVMAKFRNGRVNILIATDVAARGIDVENIDAVFNYDIPDNDEYYVHRIGRTGRAKKEGIAYTFCSNREMFRLREIMKYTKTNILPMKKPSLLDVEIKKSQALFEKIRYTITNENLKPYIEMVENQANTTEIAPIGSAEIAAALLCMQLKPQKAKKIPVAREKREPSSSMAKSRKPKEDKQFNIKDTVRLFFNVGSLDKVRRRHLEELVNDHPSLTGVKISGIDIYDKFSFMEVPISDAIEISESLSGMKFKGRTLAVEIALSPKKRENKSKSTENR